MSRVPTLSSPFLLGFEEIERALDRVAKAADGYPPYNVERLPAAKDRPERIRITLELPHRLRRWRQTDQIKVQAACKRSAIRFGRRRKAAFAQLCANEFVHWIANPPVALAGHRRMSRRFESPMRVGRSGRRKSKQPCPYTAETHSRERSTLTCA